MRTINSNFGDVEWGPDEAKGDSLLKTYFVRIPEYDALMRGEYRYIIGRKGTGKTAIIEQMASDINEQYDSFRKYLSLKDFPIQNLRSMKDRGMNNKSQYVPIWTFLILIELCKLVTEDRSLANDETVREIAHFLSENFPGDIGFAETLTRLAGNERKVSVSSRWIGGERSPTTSRSTFVPVHYRQVTDILIDYLKRIDSECKYYLLFDELDEGYNVGDSNLNLLLLALLRAVENTALTFRQSGIRYLPVLALRSDIYAQLEDNDLNKLDDYIITLKWSKEYGAPYSLLDLVNARINASIAVFDPDQAWENVVDHSLRKEDRKDKSIWAYIYARTFERPRDIIKYMKCCKKAQKSPGRLTWSAVKDAERDYSNWFYGEYKDEAQSFLPVYKEVLNAITNLGKGRFRKDELIEKFKEIPAINRYIENKKTNYEEILKYLFDASVIGTYGNNRKWLFKYKDSDLPFDSNKSLILHFGFAKKLRINV